MSTFTQIRTVTAMNLRSIPGRFGSSCVVVIGIAGVVGVIVSVLAMTQSLSRTLVETGRHDRAIVLRSGATSESASTLSVDAVLTIKDAPGIARSADGEAAASAEMVAAVNLLRKADGTRAGVTVRGIERAAFAVRPELELVDGRMFEPGLREMIVGRGAHAEFEGIDIGGRIGLRDSQWIVVGVFASRGDAHESGVMVDAATLLSAYQRTAANSLTVLLNSDAAFEDFKAALTTNPTLSVSVEREQAFYQRQSENAGSTLRLIAYFVGAIMALGALFGALNTMYSAVSTRTVEIATLRAIGFGAGGVVASVLAEALALALLGGLLGAGIAWLLFSGNTISMGGGITALVFQMRVTPELLGTGILWACAVGLIGGLFPAVRAARLPVATALRAI